LIIVKGRKQQSLCDCVRLWYPLPLVVGEGDPLGGHLEVDDSGGRGRVGAQRHAGGFLHRLDAGQRLHLHGAQVPHVAGCGGHAGQVTTTTGQGVRLLSGVLRPPALSPCLFAADYLRPVLAARPRSW